MKLAALLLGFALTGLGAFSNVTLSTFPTISSPAIAAEGKGAPKISVSEKIATIAKNKGQIGGGDQLRRFFYGDLEPVGVQPGGAGMVVNLYNKESDTTFAYCATYDVVVAVKKGKVTLFAANEVK